MYSRLPPHWLNLAAACVFRLIIRCKITRRVARRTFSQFVLFDKQTLIQICKYILQERIIVNRLTGYVLKVN